jgi:5-aminolevulinate synthase
MLPYPDVFEASLRKPPEDGSSRPVTVRCADDDLGTGHRPEILGATHAALDRSGAGAGGTRSRSGTAHEPVLPERDLADLDGTESALLFTSVYGSNLAALKVLGQGLPGSVVLSDAGNYKGPGLAGGVTSAALRLDKTRDR